ncbi:hypothetical protein SLS60_003658 [Paraconiothyrium brasiliense]|uniref:AAA+ ATPase domain-containing protein n=1 Tax=Paraconiothyrium brasiliense TaxID=300254 RepID=A0ABR3RPA0_9PLEO
MAEAIGLAVGFIGLVGLFSTCVDAFKFVQVCGSRTADYEVLQTMLDNQQFELMTWGKACGFMEEERVNPIFDDPSSAYRNRRIEDTLEKIQSLLMNAEKLKEMYGLKVQRAPIGSRLIERAPLSAFSKAFQSTKLFCNTSLQRKTRIADSIRWAVHDGEKFDRLVRDLRDLVEDLGNLTKDMGIARSQRIVVEYEMEMIDDEPTLEIIAAASVCDDDDDLLSHAASRRLSRVREQSIAGRSVAFDDSVSMFSNQRYAPSVSTLIEDDENEVQQEIGITRVPYHDWRKVKPRAELYPALKTLIVATGTPNDVSDVSNGIRPLSRMNTFNGDAVTSTKECPSRVAINSRTLISTLRRITSNNLRISSKSNVLVYPFKPIIVYYDAIKQYSSAMAQRLKVVKDRSGDQSVDSSKQSHPDKIESNTNLLAIEKSETTDRRLEEIDCLIGFIESDLADLLHLQSLIRDGLMREIEFEHLWLLFTPGVVVVSSTPEGCRGYQVLHVTGGRLIIDLENSSKTERKDADAMELQFEDQGNYGVISSRKYSDFVIDCFFIDHNGSFFGPRSHRIVISEYSGKCDVEALPAYPLTISFKTPRTDLHERGERYVQYLEGAPRLQYYGPVLHPLHIDRVQLRDTQASDLSLDDLVLPYHQKSILTSVTHGQLRGSLSSNSSRRSGLVILFHGPPGVGKTVTAETLAARLNKPLMTLDVADFEGKTKETERNITSLFFQADRWGCILLMREAELVLEQRRHMDREGNNIVTGQFPSNRKTFAKLVPVFRNALAHFSGTLILTTNRVRTLDMSLKSHIHLKLYFPLLIMDAYLQLWKLELRRLSRRCETLNQEILLDYIDIMRFATRLYQEAPDGQIGLNGREIKNAIATAYAIAQSEADGKRCIQLKEGHFRVVQESSNEVNALGRMSRRARSLSTQSSTSDDAPRDEPLTDRTVEYKTPGKKTTRDPPVTETIMTHDTDSDESGPDDTKDKGTKGDDIEEDDIEIQQLQLELEMAKLRKKRDLLKGKQASSNDGEKSYLWYGSD